MIGEPVVRQLAENHLSGKLLFLVEVQVRPGNRITVFIDGDHGVTVDDCREMNLFLNDALDKEKEDFDLTVSSAGADRPLRMPRQFAKNTGRSICVETREGEKITGVVIRAGEEGVELQVAPEKKQKKNQDTIVLSIPYKEMKTAKEVITFKQ